MHPFLIITIICSFIFLLYYVLIYIRTKVPITITPKKYYKELFDNFEIKPGLIIYELGSGRLLVIIDCIKYIVDRLILQKITKIL